MVKIIPFDMDKKTKTKIRKSEVGKRFEKWLPTIGYTNDNTIEKVWQHKTRPPLIEAIEIEKKYGFPCMSWENIHGFLKENPNFLIQEE